MKNREYTGRQHRETFWVLHLVIFLFVNKHFFCKKKKKEVKKHHRDVLYITGMVVTGT